jgi:hypothetical protein
MHHDYNRYIRVSSVTPAARVQIRLTGYSIVILLVGSSLYTTDSLLLLLQLLLVANYPVHINARVSAEVF